MHVISLWKALYIRRLRQTYSRKLLAGNVLCNLSKEISWHSFHSWEIKLDWFVLSRLSCNFISDLITESFWQEISHVISCNPITETLLAGYVLPYFFTVISIFTEIPRCAMTMVVHPFLTLSQNSWQHWFRHSANLRLEYIPEWMSSFAGISRNPEIKKTGRVNK